MFCGLISNWWLVPDPFCFLQLCPLKGTGFGRKNKLNFSKGFLIILCQNTLFLKELLTCNGRFGLFHKIRKRSGINFSRTFSAWFFHKNFPYLILYQRTNVTPYFFLKISNKGCFPVLIYAVDDIINFKIFLESTSKAMADREKNRGRRKYKNLNISRTKRAL